jgi:hypothetical protein
VLSRNLLVSPAPIVQQKGDASEALAHTVYLVQCTVRPRLTLPVTVTSDCDSDPDTARGRPVASRAGPLPVASRPGHWPPEQRITEPQVRHKSDESESLFHGHGPQTRRRTVTARPHSGWQVAAARIACSSPSAMSSSFKFKFKFKFKTP